MLVTADDGDQGSYVCWEKWRKHNYAPFDTGAGWRDENAPTFEQWARARWQIVWAWKSKDGQSSAGDEAVGE
jgi:hypothetical protein